MDFREKYEIYNHNYALEILNQAFHDEWESLQRVLMEYEITVDDLCVSGGSETPVTKKFDEIMTAARWRGCKISADLNIHFYDRNDDMRGRYDDFAYKNDTIKDYISGCTVDYMKGKLALDFEWNLKEMNFDKDLHSLRTFYDCDLISVGIILTKSSDLLSLFEGLVDDNGNPLKKKYGSTSTWMNKLQPRLTKRQTGGCPILALGIKSAVVKR